MLIVEIFYHRLRSLCGLIAAALPQNCNSPGSVRFFLLFMHLHDGEFHEGLTKIILSQATPFFSAFTLFQVGVLLPLIESRAVSFVTRAS